MTDPSLAPDFVWDIAQKGGVVGVAIIAWWLEHKERQELQKRNDALVDRLEKVATNATIATNRLSDILTAGGGHNTSGSA